MRFAYSMAGTFALALVFGAASPANAAGIRLMPPVSQPAPSFGNAQLDQDRALRILRERHPEVFTAASATSRYMVAVLLRADGSVERTETRPLDEGSQSFSAPMSPDVSRSSMLLLRKGSALPDGSALKSDVMLQVGVLPAGYDPTRSVSRVQQIVRARHPELLLPANGEVLNRLTVFLGDSGQIEREHVEQIRFDSLRRAPLEDEHFAERMAERFTQTLALEVRQIGVVGFTYVEEGSPRRTLLVQYAWQRKPGETGPSMPMATSSQQQLTQSFDNAAALALAQQHFSEAFSRPEAAAGTPTIVLDMQGEVLRVGRVQYRSGQIHETSIHQQLLPGIRLERLISPTLQDSTGGSAVITFAWVSIPAR